MPLALLFFKVTLAIMGLGLQVLRLFFSISVKTTIGMFIGTALNLYFTLDSILILILPIYEHGISSHILVFNISLPCLIIFSI